MNEEMPKCEWHECGRDATYLAEGRHGEPLLSRYEDRKVWLCDRDMRVVRILAERFDRTLTLTPRWRLTAEQLLPPF